MRSHDQLHIRAVLWGSAAGACLIASLAAAAHVAANEFQPLPPVIGPPSPSSFAAIEPFADDLEIVPEQFAAGSRRSRAGTEDYAAGPRPWSFQLLPDGLLWHSYLAGTKEPRFAAVWSHQRGYGRVWDVALGGRTGIWRYGTCGACDPEGWQFDLEGGVFPRLDPVMESTPLIAADFRVGLPLTWKRGPWQAKFAYYHISSHLGDEWMLLFPEIPRINYTRDALALGVGYFWTENVRMYGELGCALSSGGGAEPIELQFGIEYSPVYLGLRGAPFAAANGHLREDVDYSGNVVLQTGWQWRGASGKRFRLGLQYYNGLNDQYEFFDTFESKLGFGLWYDF